MNKDKTTLSVGNYIIEQTKGGFAIFSTDDSGMKDWIATCADPQKAMEIVEGLILVEHKRFHYPESTPVFKPEVKGESLPSHLQNTSEKSGVPS